MASLQHQFGYVVSTSDNFVVREKLTKDGAIEIYVHRREDGKEILPRAYVMGSNMLALGGKR